VRKNSDKENESSKFFEEIANVAQGLAKKVEVLYTQLNIFKIDDVD